MKTIFSKFKNIHFLWIVGVICFLTYYVPVKFFTNYVEYIPEWSIIFFVSGTMIPLWFNEFMWRSSRFTSNHYMMFHDLYFENKEWKSKTCNVWLVVTKYFKWTLRDKLFISLTLLNIGLLVFGFLVEYNEDLFQPFTPFYICNSIWWITILAMFNKFKNEVEMGRIRYGKRKKNEPKTHFMEEWFEEERRVLKNEKRHKNI